MLNNMDPVERVTLHGYELLAHAWRYVALYPGTGFGSNRRRRESRVEELPHCPDDVHLARPPLLPCIRLVTHAPALCESCHSDRLALRTDHTLQPDSPRAAPLVHTPPAVVRCLPLSAQQALSTESP